MSESTPPNGTGGRRLVPTFLTAPLTRRTSLGSLAAAILAAPSCAQDRGQTRPRNIGLFRRAREVAIPDGVNLVQTSGYNRIGWGAARYSFDPAIDRAAAAKRPFDTFYSKNGRGFRLAEPVPDVTAFGAIGDGVTDDRAAIQRAIDSMATIGGTVLLPAGIFRIGSTLTMRSGVNIAGVGADYAYVDDANVFTGSWLKYTGEAEEPAIRFRSVQNIGLFDLGIAGIEGKGATLLEIGSDNKPATKRLHIQRVVAFGAYLAVRWGLGNRLIASEQCDEIVFEQFSTHSCQNGFVIDAVNAADFSKIDGGSLNNLTETGFDLRAPGFMQINNISASMARDGGVMFKISGSSADPVRISGCQSEGARANFLEYNAINDQSIIVLESNVVNQPVLIHGIVRIVSRENYINAEVRTEGFARWRSYDDNFAGVYGKPSFVEQIIIGEGGQFRAESLKDSLSFVGKYLPAGFIIYESGASISDKISSIVTRKGIMCRMFAPSTNVTRGMILGPLKDNGHAYLVIAAGKTGSTEPIWPTESGAIFISGSAKLQEIGPSAVLERFEIITR